MVVPPLQMVVLPVIETVGKGLTVTVVVAVLVQLFASVPITVYPVLVVGETVIASVDCPEAHT